MTTKERAETIKKTLESLGAENIQEYLLINNSGYTFTLDGIKCDLRHWRNVYGEACDFWSAWANTSEPSERAQVLERLQTIKRAANRINEL